MLSRRFDSSFDDPFFEGYRDHMREMEKVFQNPFQGLGLEAGPSKGRREVGAGREVAPRSLFDFGGGFDGVFQNMHKMMGDMQKQMGPDAASRWKWDWPNKEWVPYKPFEFSSTDNTFRDMKKSMDTMNHNIRLSESPSWDKGSRALAPLKAFDYEGLDSALRDLETRMENIRRDCRLSESPSWDKGSRALAPLEAFDYGGLDSALRDLETRMENIRRDCDFGDTFKWKLDGPSRDLVPRNGFDFGGVEKTFQNIRRSMDDLEWNAEKAARDPNSHMFTHSSFSSYSKAGGAEPKVYHAAASTTQAPGGIRETRKALRDSEAGQDKMAIGRYIGDRGQVIERQRDRRTGREEENRELKNMAEEDAYNFEREWKERTNKYADRRSERYGRGLDRGEGRRALPAAGRRH